MSSAVHAPGQSHQDPYEPITSAVDWVEVVSVGLASLIAVAMVAGILALLIII